MVVGTSHFDLKCPPLIQSSSLQQNIERLQHICPSSSSYDTSVQPGKLYLQISSEWKHLLMDVPTKKGRQKRNVSVGSIIIIICAVINSLFSHKYIHVQSQVQSVILSAHQPVEALFFKDLPQTLIVFVHPFWPSHIVTCYFYI